MHAQRGLTLYDNRFLREASFTLTRRAAGQPDKVWLESGLYPSYYLNSWHYQTDGWLSEESAKVYEASTETVFVGESLSMYWDFCFSNKSKLAKFSLLSFQVRLL